MRKNMWTAMFAAACSLCGVHGLGAQQERIRVVRHRQPPKTAVAEPAQAPATGMDVAFVKYDTLPNRQVRITFSPPALKTDDDYRAVYSEDQDAYAQKLACLTPSEALALFQNVPKTIEAWDTALQGSRMCDFKKTGTPGPVQRSSLYVLERKPWYEPDSMYKPSTLRGNDPSTRYVIHGFGGDLNTLADEMKGDFTFKIATQSDSLGRPTQWKDTTVTVRGWFYSYGGVDSAETAELINLVITGQCKIVQIPPGMPYYKNTGRGIVGLNRVFNPDATGMYMEPLKPGEKFLVARCTLKSGRVIDILEHCTNIAHPLMGVQYTFTVTPPLPAVEKKPPETKPKQPLPPPTKRRMCSGWIGAGECIAAACAVVTGIDWAINGPNLCGISLHHKAAEGNKPKGAPIQQFDRRPSLRWTFSFTTP